MADDGFAFFSFVISLFIIPFIMSTAYYYKKSFPLFVLHLLYIVYIMFFNTPDLISVLTIIVAVGSPLSITFKFDEYEITTKHLIKCLYVIRVICVCLYPNYLSNNFVGYGNVDNIMK